MKIIQQICTSEITCVVSLLKQIEQIADVAFDDKDYNNSLMIPLCLKIWKYWIF
jgi:hypothetical protein